MVDRRRQRTRPARRLRRLVTAGLLAATLPLPRTASAGAVTDGSATSQAVVTNLTSLIPPEISLREQSGTLQVGPEIGQQTLPGTLDVRDPTVRADSSLVASSTSLTVSRSATAVGATAVVDGFALTLLGKSVASATSLDATVSCPADDPVQAAAQVSELRLGDAPPVDVSMGQAARGSTAITDADGNTYVVETIVNVEVSASGNDAEALAMRLVVEINGSSIGLGALALVTCGRPGGDLDGAAPGPDGGLAESGTDTAMVAALLGVVLVAGGGSALLGARKLARSAATDRRPPIRRTARHRR